MTLRHLRIFQTVTEKKSVTGAAEALGMTQPAVSIALRELEAFYGTRLFDRVGRGVRPTAAGERLSVYASDILSKMESSIAALRVGKSGTLCRVGVNPTVGEGRFPAVFRRLQAALPTVSFRLTVERSEMLEQRLSMGELDLAVTDCFFERRNRRVKALFQEEMKLVCAPTFPLPETPLSPEELAGLPLLVREKGSGSRECARELLSESDVPAYVSVESVSNQALLAMAEEGIGVSILPASTVQTALAEGKLRQIPYAGRLPVRHYYLIRHSQAPLSPELVRCMELLGDLFAKSE